MAGIWEWLQANMQTVMGIVAAIIGLFTVNKAGLPRVAGLTLPVLKATSFVTRDPRDQDLIDALKATIVAHKENKVTPSRRAPPAA